MLRALSSPNLDIRRKTLDIALDLITSRNIDEVGCQPFSPTLFRWVEQLVMVVGGLLPVATSHMHTPLTPPGTPPPPHLYPPGHTAQDAGHRTGLDYVTQHR